MKVQLYTREEVAEMLRLSVRTLDRLRKRGDGPPYIALGRHIRYEASLLDDWIKARAKGAANG